ncbi:hypothetical protein GF322_01050 [Candidatus Dependentiae bacterium]|nr:hypothetical protein [Candidatus Dependentiae bacterium]
MKKLIFLLLIILFSNCAYQAKKINLDYESELSYQETKNNIEIIFKSIDTESQDSYLNNFITLHLQIKNKSSKPYIIKAQNINVLLSTLEQIKKQIPKIYLKDFIPSTLFLGCGIFFWWQICLPLVAISSIGAVFYSKFKNKQILKNFSKLMLQPNESFLINPNKQLNKIIFINKKNYNPKFDLYLINKKNETEIVNFNVFLTAKNKISYTFE